MYGIIVYDSSLDLDTKKERQKFLRKHRSKVILTKITEKFQYTFLLKKVDSLDKTYFYNEEKFIDEDSARLAFDLL